VSISDSHDGGSAALLPPPPKFMVMVAVSVPPPAIGPEQPESIRKRITPNKHIAVFPLNCFLMFFLMFLSFFIIYSNHNFG
jgi:hypothetical protein